MSTKNPKDFYSSLGDGYDLMTNDVKRWRSSGDQFRDLLYGLDVKNILDVGCGTGGEAIALGEAGYDVIGVDVTAEFIDMARRKSRGRKHAPRFIVDEMTKLVTVDDDSVDLAICKGNTLPHLLTEGDLRATLESFSRVVRPGGHLLLQWLNYVPVLRDRKRLVGCGGVRDNSYIRFYDFEDDSTLRFNIIHLTFTDVWKQEWNVTRLKPWLHDKVQDILLDLGWDVTGVWSDLRKSDFDPDESHDVTLLARR